MKIAGLAGIWQSHMALQPVAGRSYAPTRPRSDRDQVAQIRFARSRLKDLRKALLVVQRDWRVGSGQGTKTAATTRSATDLGLGTPTSAYLESTAEVNSDPYSFSTHGPGWSGTSTSLATVDGAYDGTNGTGTFTFEVAIGGVVGTDTTKIDMLDGSGTKVDSIVMNAGTPAGTVHTLANGLELSFDAASLVKGDTFTLDLSTTQDSAAVAGNAFNGTRTADANLEYGLDVTAGSFEVNGLTIAVYADDSIDSVLARITASAAGVTASYSDVTEKITLTHDTAGPGTSITLENDTSGFLAATKLAGAGQVDGADSSTASVLADLPRFAATTAGNILVNGVGVALDPATDTLADIIARFNSAGAGASAEIDATGRWVSFTSDDPDAQLVLDDNGTSFLAALEITAGTVDPTTGARGRRISGPRTTRIIDAMKDISTAINALFGTNHPDAEVGSWLEGVRTNLRGTLTALVEDKGARELGEFGIAFAWDTPGGRAFAFYGKDRDDLESGMRRRTRALEELLFTDGTGRNVGMIDALMGATEASDATLVRALGMKGIRVDTYA